MSFFDFGKVCLFSEISGVITLNGVPVVNAKLTRTASGAGEKFDETSTNAEGYFHFPAMFEHTISTYLPQEFSASQKIIVHYANKEYQMWSGVKRDKEENSESRGNSLVVQCELNSEENLKVVNRSPIFSLCRWEAAADPKENFF